MSVIGSHCRLLLTCFLIHSSMSPTIETTPMSHSCGVAFLRLHSGNQLVILCYLCRAQIYVPTLVRFILTGPFSVGILTYICCFLWDHWLPRRAATQLGMGSMITPWPWMSGQQRNPLMPRHSVFLHASRQWTRTVGWHTHLTHTHSHSSTTRSCILSLLRACTHERTSGFVWVIHPNLMQSTIRWLFCVGLYTWSIHLTIPCGIARSQARTSCNQCGICFIKDWVDRKTFLKMFGNPS